MRSFITKSAFVACSLFPVGCGSSSDYVGPDNSAGSAGSSAGSTSVASGGEGAVQVVGGAPGSGGSAGIGAAGAFSSGGTAGGENASTAGVSGGGESSTSGGVGGNSTAGANAGGSGASGGGVGGSAGTGGSANNAYSPCPVSPSPCVVLPFGDSITYGYGSMDLGGYRSRLFALAVADGKALTFVGSSADGPTTVSGKPFPRQHEGHAGYTIAGPQGILQFVQQGIIKNFKPNIVLLEIGTNDISQNIDLTNAPSRLGQLIDAILADAPAAQIVVAQITPSQKEPANTNTTTYNAALPAVVAQRVKQGKHVLLVDMNTPFLAQANWKKTLMTDSVHPNDAGYAILGRVWYGALASELR